MNRGDQLKNAFKDFFFTPLTAERKELEQHGVRLATDVVEQVERRRGLNGAEDLEALEAVAELVDEDDDGDTLPGTSFTPAPAALATRRGAR